MSARPLRNAGIEIDEPGIRSHEVGDGAEDNPSKEHGSKSNRQGESRGCLRIQSADHRPAEPTVVRELAPHRLGGGKAWCGRGERRRVVPGHECDSHGDTK